MGVLQVVRAQLLSHVTTAIFFGVVYANFILWREYAITLLWAFVVSQALHSPKARLMQAITTLSNEDDKPMVWVLWSLVTDPFKRMRAKGKSVLEMVFTSALNWCMELFALVGLMSVTSRLSWWLLGVTPLLLYGLVYVLDRRVFAYRRVMSDNTAACSVVIITFFASVSFVVLFLGLESVLEGLNAGQVMSAWVQSIVDENMESGWSQSVARAREIAMEQATRFESQYNETAWFPLVRSAVSDLMQHGTLTASAGTCVDDSCETASMTGFLGDYSGFVDAAKEQVSGLNISMEHLAQYGEPSGKIIGNGATLLVSFGSYLVMVGFKAVLFFTSVFYMTSYDDFLERNIGDFLPISQADRKSAMTMLRGALQGVFFLPCKVACLHGMVTLVSFKVLQIELPFFASLLVVLVSVLPIVPAYIVCWPWALTLVVRGRWLWGVVLAVSQNLIFSIVDTELCTQGVQDAHPYMTSLTSFLGFSVFGAQGVLLGPLLMCLGTFTYGVLTFLENSTSQGMGVSSNFVHNAAGVDTGQNQSTDTSSLCKEVMEPNAGTGVSHNSDLANLPNSRDITRRATLRLARNLPSIEETPNEQGDEQRTVRPTWRLKYSSSLTWEAFLHEVQDVMGIASIYCIYGSDRARIRRVEFIEDGEVLDVVPGNPSGLG